jgi:protein SCO1/2
MTGTTRAWLAVVLGAVVAAAALYTLGARRGEPLPEIGGFVLAEPRALDFALVDSEGQPFGPHDFTGHWSFLYFGFTHCPDVCPLSLIELTELKKKLEAQAPDVAAEYFLVSVDPARDTPQVMKDYVTYFDPAFRGLTGEPEQVAELAKAVGAIYFVPPGQSSESYVVSHSSNVTLIDPQGRLHAVFTSPHTPQQLAEDFAKVLARYRKLEGELDG